MKKIILVGAFALLAACGSSAKDSLPAAGADDTSASANTSGGAASTETSLGGTDDTITVSDLSDMPPKCVELLGKFLKQIEPTVSKIDWDKATLADFEAFGDQFQAESDSFDTQTAARPAATSTTSRAPTRSSSSRWRRLRKARRPGPSGSSSSSARLPPARPGPAVRCRLIATARSRRSSQFVKRGGTMQDLTMAEVTRIGQLITAVQTNCTSEQATALFDRADVKAFMGG